MSLNFLVRRIEMNIVELKKLLEKNEKNFNPTREDYDIEIRGKLVHPIKWTKIFLEWVDYFETYYFGAAALKNGVFKYESVSGRSRVEVNLLTGHFKYEGSPHTEVWWPIGEGKTFEWRVEAPASYAPPKEEKYEIFDEGLPAGLVPRWAA